MQIICKKLPFYYYVIPTPLSEDRNKRNNVPAPPVCLHGVNSDNSAFHNRGCNVTKYLTIAIVEHKYLLDDDM
jgi:hypothetical protein